MVKGKDGSLKLCCPDCKAQGNNKPFRNFVSLKNHLRYAGTLSGHKPRSLEEIYQLIFRSEVIHVDGRGRKKKAPASAAPGSKAAIELKN